MSIYSLIFIFYIISLFVQLFFYLFFFTRLLFVKSCQKGKAPMQPISLVVCAHNEASNLKKLIPALQKQKYDNYEVIIVNDRSTDETSQLLRKATKQHPAIKSIDIENVPKKANPKKHGLSAGISAASNDLLVFTDADCVPSSNEWLQEIASRFEANTNIVLGYSQYKKAPGLLNLFIRFETLYTGIQYLTFAICGRPYMGVGRNLAYRKTLFNRGNGFTSHLKVTGGDDDLFVNKNANQFNTNIAIGRNSLVLSEPKKSWKAYFLQKRRHLSVGKFYNTYDKLILGILSLSHIIFWFTFLILAIKCEEPYFIFGGFLMRMAALNLVFIKSAKKLGDKINPVFLPLLDLIYVCYYLATGFSAIVSKNVKWN